MYPSHTHSPRHCDFQSSETAHLPPLLARHSEPGAGPLPLDHAHVTASRSMEPYTLAKTAMAVYPIVSESPDAKPLAAGPHRSIMVRIIAVHARPWLAPRKSEEKTTADQPRSPRVGAPSTMIGARMPTPNPATATRFRPNLSASPPTRRLHTALDSANGTRNALLSAYDSRAY